MSDFKLPDLGENIESGDVVSVLVKEGDSIQPQQDVIEIETDKAVIAVPSNIGGTVTKIHVARGQSVKPGQVILSLQPLAAGSSGPAKVSSAPVKATSAPAKSTVAPAKKPIAPVPAASSAAGKSHASKAATPAPATASKPASAAKAASAPTKSIPAAAQSVEHDKNGHFGTKTSASDGTDDQDGASTDIELHDTKSPSTSPAGPAVRRLARELGVDLARVQGTGPDGRITREDVIIAVRHANATVTNAAATASVNAEARDQYGTIRREAMSKIRKTIAANMVRSATTIPHLTNFDDADITELDRLRKESATAYTNSGIKLTSLAFVLKAVALALEQHPTLNASIDMDAGEIVYKRYVNLGVAVDTDRGLIVPVLRGVDQLSIPQIAQGVQSMAEKVRHNQQSLDDLRGGTFTISNLGAVGGQYSTPIINFPEAAILLVGRSRKIPAVTAEDKIEARLTMPLSLSYDHRLVDGAAASRFLNEVIGYLESPGRLLLAP
jgi:pyruvate/2-oxoglutarate dehydrogenase complex dihydrolipoamide acyltransferase (E2) component